MPALFNVHKHKIRFFLVLGGLVSSVLMLAIVWSLYRMHAYLHQMHGANDQGLQARILEDGDAIFLATAGIAVACIAMAGGAVAYLLHRLNHHQAGVQNDMPYSSWIANQLFDLSTNSLIVMNADGLIERVNPAFIRMTGYGREEVLGSQPRLLCAGRQSLETYEELWRCLREVGSWQGTLWHRRKNGDVYLESVSILGIGNASRGYTHYVSVSTDVTQRQLVEERLSHLALHDPLTGLPNRLQFHEHLNHAIARARRTVTQVAVMFVDLDGFKQVNDRLGHSFGDAILKAVAERIQIAIRDCDIVARMGGDEFTIVLEDIQDVQHLGPIAQQILAAIAQGGDVGRVDVPPLTASIGISIYPDHAGEPKELLELADRAMYEAKHAGKNNFRFFSPRLGLEQAESVRAA